MQTTERAAARKKVAITGGIGSGKSYVCQRLMSKGIEVYDCDAGAKRLMHSSPELREKLQRLVGEEVYMYDGEEWKLNKPLMARFLLQSEANAQAVNDIVHPAVAADFAGSGKDWLESAIFFDSGFQHRVVVDKVVCVTAPLEVRVCRVMVRDGISRKNALEWVDRQLPQETIVALSDYEIVNDGIQDIDQQLDFFLSENGLWI